MFEAFFALDSLPRPRQGLGQRRLDSMGISIQFWAKFSVDNWAWEWPKRTP